VQYALFPGLGMKHLLPRLTARLHPLNSPASSASVIPFRAPLPKAGEDPLGEHVISHLYFWPRISRFIRTEDVIVTETGTSSFGALEMPLPAKTIYLSQILWGSIGWATGAAVGAAFGARERRLKGRTLLFTGDGSLQLTVQELSTAMRHGLAPILFVLNNNGYTIERLLHGRERHYNEIVNWYIFAYPTRTLQTKFRIGNGRNSWMCWLRRTCRQSQSRTLCERRANWMRC
jgi:pyruvate decarboxylase